MHSAFVSGTNRSRFDYSASNFFYSPPLPAIISRLQEHSSEMIRKPRCSVRIPHSILALAALRFSQSIWFVMKALGNAHATVLEDRAKGQGRGLFAARTSQQACENRSIRRGAGNKSVCYRSGTVSCGGSRCGREHGDGCLAHFANPRVERSTDNSRCCPMKTTTVRDGPTPLASRVSLLGALVVDRRRWLPWGPASGSPQRTFFDE